LKQRVTKHFQAVLEMEAPEELRGLARDGLRKIAAQELKARGPRMDTAFYLLDAMRLFHGKSLPGRTFFALQLICIMYAGFKRIEPGMDIGVDLGEEWRMVERMLPK
jgi:hypothetical protein